MRLKRWKAPIAAWLSFLMVVGGFVLSPSNVSAATSFSNVTLNTTTPAVYDKFEMTFNLSTTYTNPFNPDEVDVKAYILTPSGQTEVVPGFYLSNTSPKWAVRYSPRQTGSHSVYLTVTDSSGTGQSSTYTFNAGSPGANRGFMGVSGSRFVDSFGKQLTLIGTNYAWGSPSDILTAIPQYGAAKMNLMRVWYSVWWGNYAPEYGPVTTTQNGITMSYDGVGKYQLENQARMDTLMETAAANNVYIMLTMNSFGDFFYNWSTNAYNTANGGPSYWTENNTDFWTNPTSIDYQKKLLRYVFARWGYNRALGMIEYWNESDNRVDTSAEIRAAWHEEVDTYWKSLDFYNRPTTTSFAWKDNSQFNQPSWENLTTLDATNFHRYNGSADAANVWESELKHFIADFGGRPAFVAEYGITEYEDPNDPLTERFIHDGLWAPIFRAGAAGGNLFWYFASLQTFNVPANIKSLHTALANFVQPEEAHMASMPFIDYGAQSNSTKVGGYKKADRALLWINDATANHTVSSPRTVSGMSFSLTGMTNGTYDVIYYNTVTGANISQTTATASGGTLTLSSIPSFTRDIAVKVIPQGSSPADTQAPTAPAGLNSPSKTDTTVDLAWTASTDNVGVTAYDIYRDGTLRDTVGGAVTTYGDTGLTASTAYTYTVKARDAAGNVSAASGALNVTTSAPSTNLLLNPGFETDNGSGKPASWTVEQDHYASRNTAVKRSGSSSLRIEGTAGAWFGWYQEATATAGSAYTFDGYVNITANTNTKLDIKLQFVNSAGSVLADNIVTSYAGGATTTGFANVNGTFTAPVNTAKVRVYSYFRDLNGTFYFDDFSINGPGGGVPDTQAPTAPTGLTSPSKTDTTVNLSWTASTDNVGVAGYDIYQGSTLTGSTTGATTFTVNGLVASTAYSFTVKAKDAAGNVSAASSAVNVTTNAATPWNPSAVYKLVNRNSGLALDVSGASVADGGNVIQWTDNGANNQRWTIASIGGGSYKITSVNSGKLLDVSSSSTVSGADVIQWTDNGGANQHWQIVSVGGGYYKIVNVNSGMVLDVSGAWTAPGGDVVQSTDTGATSQQWSIIQM